MYEVRGRNRECVAGREAGASEQPAPARLPFERGLDGRGDRPAGSDVLEPMDRRRVPEERCEEMPLQNASGATSAVER